MYSREHLAISLVVATVAVVPTAPPVHPALAVGFAAVVGVGIDLDHFLLARANTGDWRALRRCLRDPRIVVLDQSAILREGEVLPFQRLASHLAIGGPLVAGIAFASPYLAWLAALTLWAHLIADAAWEYVYRERRPAT